jgi:hypothetical protein
MVRRRLIAFVCVLSVLLYLGSTGAPAHWKTLLYSIYTLGYGNPDSLGSGELANRKVARLDLNNTFTAENTFDSLVTFEDSTTFKEMLTFEDSARYWDDLRFPLSNLIIGPVKSPGLEVFIDGTRARAFSPDEWLYGAGQTPHGWDQDTIDAHIHWTIPTSGSGGGVENVRWMLEYTFQGLTGVFPATDTLYVETDVQDSTAYTHFLSDFGPIPPPGTKTLSSMVVFQIGRANATANEYGAEAFGLEVDFHLRYNRLGSKLEDAE